MKKYLIIIIIAIALFGCGGKKQEQATDSTVVVKDTTSVVDADTSDRFSDFHGYITTAAVSDENIQVMDSACAVMINPTDEQIEALTKEMSEDDFATIADDASFYMSNATTTLDSFHIKVVQAEKPFLKLQSSNASWLLDIRQKDAPEWNVIFFQPKKEPKVISGIDVNRESIRSYFDLP